jgi:hypothetical protein
MANMIILVMKDQVNRQHIDDVRADFVLGHAFTRELPGYAIGATIMMRDIRIRAATGVQLSLAENNEMKMASDPRQRRKNLEILNEAGVTLSENDLLALAQETFRDEKLYWNSIEDVLIFTAGIASQRENITYCRSSPISPIQQFHLIASAKFALSTDPFNHRPYGRCPFR